MHNSKASLFLMEIMMSILFFTIAAVVCIQLFVKAHTLNHETEDLAKATMIAQNISECFLNGNDQISLKKQLIPYLPQYEEKQNQIFIYYDSNWDVCQQDYACYRVILHFEEDSNFTNLNINISKLSEQKQIFNHSVKKYIQRRAS